MIELSPEAMKLLGLRHWQWREAPSRTPAVSAETAHKNRPHAPVGEKAPSRASPPAQPPSQPAILPVEQSQLLHKILQAIGEDPATCRIEPRPPRRVTVYLTDGWQLEFDSLDAKENNKRVCLASLADMLTNPSLKKPVWQKLKKWASQRQT